MNDRIEINGDQIAANRMGVIARALELFGDIDWDQHNLVLTLKKKTHHKEGCDDCGR